MPRSSLHHPAPAGRIALRHRLFQPWPVLVALRYARPGRGGALLSMMAWISIAGLVLGVAVLVLVLSVMNGFDRELRDRVLGVTPHALLEARGPLADWRAAAATLSAAPGVLAVAPLTEAAALATAGGRLRGATLAGIDPVAEAQVSILGDHLQSGSLAALEAGAFRVLIGQTLARELDLAVGDRLMLVLPDAAVTPAGLFPRQKRFSVAGIFATGTQADRGTLLAHLDDVHRLLRRSTGPAALRLRVDNLFDARLIAAAAADPQLFRVLDWTQVHGNLFRAIRMQKTMLFVLLSLLVAVAAFNVVTSLVLLVQERQGDVAILRSLGSTPAAIVRLFLVVGGGIAAVGVLVGTVVGVLLALGAAGFYQFLEGLGISLMSQYFIDYLPSELLASDIVVVALVGFLTTAVAALYPARRAAALRPAEVLRHE